MTEISIIVPVYNEESNVKVFLGRLVPVISKITESYEIIFSVDPSKDNSERIIEEEIKKN